MKFGKNQYDVLEGADGLILISGHDRHDYEMKYFNSDGRLGSMCGNGARCAARFAAKSGMAGDREKFIAFDGMHEAIVSDEMVRLQMANVSGYQVVDDSYL